jgi:hypothetical protein
MASGVANYKMLVRITTEIPSNTPDNNSKSAATQ